MNFEFLIILGFAYDLELFSFDFINKGVKKPKLLNSFSYYLTVGVACIPIFLYSFLFFLPDYFVCTFQGKIDVRADVLVAENVIEACLLQLLVHLFANA